MIYLAKLTHQTHGAQRTQPKQQENTRGNSRAECGLSGQKVRVTKDNQALKGGDNPLRSHSTQVLGQIPLDQLGYRNNHHQVETKGPRTPLEVPSSRYRTRGLEKREHSQVIIQIQQKCLQTEWERVFKPLPKHATRLP